jgi:glycosyltransferase involved in cell wall biosynthesis
MIMKKRGNLSLLNHIKSFKKDLIIVSDCNGWVIDNISFNLCDSLNTLGIKSVVVRNSLFKIFLLQKNKTFYFIDRWSCLNEEKESMLRKLSRNNRIIAMWWHSIVEKDKNEHERVMAILKRYDPFLTLFTVPCNQEQQMLVRNGFSANKIKIIPEGIENFFEPCSSEKKLLLRKRLNIPANAFCIGCFQKDGIGWGDGEEPKPGKGPDIFIEVIKRLYKKYKNIFIVLTGPARGYVKRKLTEYGIPFLHSYLRDYREIVDYYQSLDLYLITSRTEGGPKSLLEALACGIPVVSTRVGMSSDIIKDGINGFLSDIENVDQLYQKTETLILDENLRTTFSENGLNASKEHYWSKIAELFIKRCMV